MKKEPVKKKIKRFIYRYVLPYGGLLLIKLLSASYRVRIVDLDKEQDILNEKGKLIYASWHQRFFPGITFFSSRKPIAIIISQSKDGEMIARAVKLLGWKPVRGSSSRGGKAALETVKQLSRRNYKIGHIVDGPTGPFGVIKPGLIRIAQAGNLPILPTITSSENRWVFNSWDKFMIPKPFSKVIIRFGDAIEIPPELTANGFEKQCGIIEKTLKTLYAETDRIWEDPERIQRIFH